MGVAVAARTGMVKKVVSSSINREVNSGNKEEAIKKAGLTTKAIRAKAMETMARVKTRARDMDMETIQRVVVMDQKIAAMAREAPTVARKEEALTGARRMERREATKEDGKIVNTDRKVCNNNGESGRQ